MTDPVEIDAELAASIVRYGGMLSRRGYIHNTLGNIAVRMPHPAFPHGLALTKHAGISLEEMGPENVVATDIPTSRIVAGSRMTSIGHNLNREILRLRPDINAVIHVHDDASIAFFGAGFTEVRVLSLDMPFVLGKHPYYLPAHMDVEADVAPVRDFIADTNLVVLLGHGLTSLGRTVSEAYHRLNAFTAEVRRNIEALQLARLTGATPAWRTTAEIEAMHRHAEAIINPTRAEGVMRAT